MWSEIEFLFKVDFKENKKNRKKFNLKLPIVKLRTVHRYCIFLKQRILYLIKAATLSIEIM
jgi:hypothetical protein